MIFDAIIGSILWLFYLPASLAPITAHLLPRSLCRSNILCSSAKLHSSLGWLGLIYVIYLGNVMLTFLYIVCHCDRGGRAILAVCERYGSIWLVHFFRIRFLRGYLLIRSMDVYLPFYLPTINYYFYKHARLYPKPFNYRKR